MGEVTSSDVAIDFIAGSLGAATSVYVGQPLDTLKVKMQTFPEMYPNLKTCFKQTWAKDGLARGLYAGTVPSLIANVAENSILFASYGVCQKLVAKGFGVPKVEELRTWQNGLSGFLAAFWSSLALCPTELVKCRQQALRESYVIKGLEPPKIGPYTVTKEILAKDGVAGLFRGLTATFTREMPGYFIFFYSYEFTRELFKAEGQSKDEIGPLGTIVSGGIAGTCLWATIFPADVIKSRLQVSGSTQPMLQAGLEIVRKEGFLALYNGLTPTLIRTFPATGALFFAYEYSKQFMKKLVE